MEQEYTPMTTLSMQVSLNQSNSAVENSPSKSSSESVTGRWSKAEHKRFLEALNLYGKNWKKVQEYVGTRTTTQARSHAQKYFAKLEEKGINPDKLESNFPDNYDELIETPKAKIANPMKTLETSEKKGKKQLKGPYAPGKQPIEFDNLPEYKNFQIGRAHV